MVNSANCKGVNSKLLSATMNLLTFTCFNAYFVGPFV